MLQAAHLSELIDVLLNSSSSYSNSFHFSHTGKGSKFFVGREVCYILSFFIADKRILCHLLEQEPFYGTGSYSFAVVVGRYLDS
jgi:hypothetical protein